MRLIDAHVHLFNLPGYLEKLISTMDKIGIERSCLSGLGDLFSCVDNVGINKYPNRLIGTYYIRPGVNTKSDILNASDQGFKMIKVTIPKKPYNHPDYFPLWQQAEELGMPILFHTGVVTLMKKALNEQISSWFMHPMRIEPIANLFPDLKMIVAHLGVHWNDDAAELIRMKKNVYADLSGSLTGWRVRMDRIGLDHWLWWPGAFKKVIFGSDVIVTDIQKILEEDKNRLNSLKIDLETQKLVFYKNILRMIGEK